MLKSLKIRNLLSFGSVGVDLPFLPLNVLIGPNGTGKSNLIDILSVFQAAPTALAEPVRKGGGVCDWLRQRGQGPSARLEAIIDYPRGPENLRHCLEFAAEGGRFSLIDEKIENEFPIKGHNVAFFFYKYENNHPVLNIHQQDSSRNRQGRSRRLKREDVDPEQSILSQRKDPEMYPEITWLAQTYGKISIYRDWTFGRYTKPRLPQPADLPNDYLLENASNLGLVLKNIQMTGGERKVLEGLRELYDGITGFDVAIQGGTVQLYLKEGDQFIPATRLSDGTLRYLSLLAVLCNPKPPGLICIEEPELGLHPDVLPFLAELLIEASQHTQLVITTHSEILVNALSEHPEYVLVCEKENDETSIRRCDAEQLSIWLEDYSLGDLWRSGQIGGNRW